MHENLELSESVEELDNLQKHFANIIQEILFKYLIRKENNRNCHIS